MKWSDEACDAAFRRRDARLDGRVFGGVRTTGIFCRPICPARPPKREHFRFFASAVAAQAAGFRPCLRCRPESAAAVDVRDLDAPPRAIEEARRVLLATQLIHETRLSMGDVALASGLGSRRGLHARFRRLFDRAPRDLRRRGPVGRLPGNEEIVLDLRYLPPYDWPAMLAFLRARAIPGVEAVRDTTYSRSLVIEGACALIAIAPAGGNALRIRLRLQALASLGAVVLRVRRVFDLGADPDDIDAHLAGDRALAPLVAARPGLRLPGAWDGFELAVRAMLGQQITVSAAVGLAAKLVARYGRRLPAAFSASGVTHAFPEPASLAGADLSVIGMPRARAAALSSLARTVMETPDLFSRRGSLEETIARLRSLPGVGDWTAHYIAMRQIREPDAFPAADIGLMRAMTGRDGRRPTARELLARAERWRPWRAYAAQHLWSGTPPVEGLRRGSPGVTRTKRPDRAD